MSQDLDIALLRTFVAIVDTGGLTSAGKKVGRTQPAITHQIQRLEDQIGRTLFDDNRRKLSLTHDGEVLLEFRPRHAAAERRGARPFFPPPTLPVTSPWERLISTHHICCRKCWKVFPTLTPMSK